MPLQGDHIFLYRVGESHTHVDGSPKSVKEVLGLDGPIDAAFMCYDNMTHIVKGNTALLAVYSILFILREVIVPNLHRKHGW